ncbi:hypothetical protein [Actinacidiphila sp. ITFR-21]|uniref:hypothetical protein n=1 Tax=Actinacidiphila sp. ITFR-21 TaxID=3075199 RepID=UPI00288B772A|nr:hypothetical protein [Streptomyces sp. ITFR-21]WNI17667.1 hypothetical protein RLT57_20470 [Streptomyces sp. ITFR-21]WNI17807.1 hypothetical protein RLT57_21185 [Streptomyces sp. ITFR-21]
MTNVITHSSPLTSHEALPLKHAAIGAARVANEAGDADLGARLMVHARHLNRVVRRGNRSDTPALAVPAVKDMQTVKASELQEHVKLTTREMARMNLLTEWTIIGEANSENEDFRPLCARKVGNSVRYMELKSSTKK